MRQTSSISVLLGGGVAGLCWWTYSGPYRWLAEWQLATFERYYEFYTFVFLAIGISTGIDQIGRAVRRHVTGHDAAPAPAWWQELESQSPRFFQMLGGGVALLVIGGCSTWSSSSAERAGLCRIPLSALESGTDRTSDWVRVSGNLLWDDCWGWGDDLTTDYYVPIVSATWRRGDPVTAFARYTESEANAAGDFETVEGMVEQSGLPGPIEAAFEEIGLEPSESSFVVDLKSTPTSHRTLNFMLMLLGLGMTVGSLFLYESQSEFVDLDVALERDEPADPPPAEIRRGAAASTLMDWTPPDTGSDCDAEVQKWLKAHNMEDRS